MYNGFNMKAPGFSLRDQNEQIHTFSEYSGKYLLIYFYPKDDTPGCTKEACNFRDGINELTKRGVEIVGISKDSVSSHKKFADKYKLNFTLLSDPEHQVIEAFGAWGIKKFMGKEFQGVKRNTYLINPSGEIIKTYENVNPLSHFENILKDLEIIIK
jgi:thioredoxin-dependent peroxiredoxin